MTQAAFENPARPSELFGALLPPGVAAAELTAPGDPALLPPPERDRFGVASSLRAREFAAGRLCARRAAAQLGVTDFPLVSHDDRRPRWPARLTGSITHTEGFSAAAVGDRRRFRAIGIDAERIGQVSPELWRHVLGPVEAAWLEELPAPVRSTGAALMFSAKEAFYKCQYEVTQQWLEFKDVAVDFLGNHLGVDSCVVHPMGRVRLFELGGGPAVVRFAVTPVLVLTAMILRAH